MASTAPTVDIPSTLKLIDEYLNTSGLLDVDLSEPLLSSPQAWIKARTRQGLDYRVAENALLTYFNIPVVDSLPDDVIVISAGYYSPSNNTLYTTKLTDKHFGSTTLGFLTRLSPDDSGPSNLPLVGDVLKAHLRGKFPRALLHNVRSVTSCDGYWWETWLSKEKVLKPVTPVEAHWASQNDFPMHNPAQWLSCAKDYREQIATSSRSLVVLAGDVPFEQELDALIAELAPSESSAVFQISPDGDLDIEAFKSRLLSGRGRTFFLSNARHASDIYAQLRTILGPELLQTSFNGYFLRIGVPKLCSLCRHEEMASCSDEGLSFAVKRGMYATKGLGCAACSNGYDGWVVLEEIAASTTRSAFLSAASAFEKQRVSQGGYIEPHELQSTLGGYRLIFQEASALPGSKTISVADLARALL
jgi:hypothetical protein